MNREKTYSAWDLSKIAKAEDLKRICPRIDRDAGWAAFVTEFDNPKHCANRQKSANSCLKPKQHSLIREIEHLCMITRTSETLAFPPQFSPDGSKFYLTEEQATKKRIDASITLAETVWLLLSPSKNGEGLRRKFKAEAGRKSKGAKKRSMTDLCLALLEFIRREERLPTKKELNIEANRLHHCLHGYSAEEVHGKIIQPKGTTSVADLLVVYDCGPVTAFDESRNLVTRMECRIVPYHEWEEPRWSVTNYSDLSTPCGLKGLPEAHKDKGPGKVRH